MSVSDQIADTAHVDPTITKSNDFCVITVIVRAHSTPENSGQLGKDDRF
jgi:hypothetical protein